MLLMEEMMKKVVVLRGLPASGKSTWAKAKIDKNPGAWTRVNKDDLRMMMHNGKWSKANEKLVLDARDALIHAALEKGQHVIVDDTNLHESHIARIKQITKGLAEVEVKDFEISVEAAVKRDLNRDRSVGREVIERMYNQFIKEPAEVIEKDPTLTDAIIVDVDGNPSSHGWQEKPLRMGTSWRGSDG